MTAKLATNATDRAAREELWISFRALLQAYLAAGSVGSDMPRALLAESGSHSLQIVGSTRTINLELKPDAGEGYWAVFSGPNLLDEGAFRLHLDAEFEWSGKPGRLPIDAVAEALATLVAE